MTEIQTDSGAIVVTPAVPLSRDEARALTDEVRSDLAHTWLKVLVLYEGAAYAALDYSSWREYWEEEFGGSGTRGEQYIRAGRVCRVLAQAGLPLPASDTVARALTPVARNAPDKLPELWTQALEDSGGKPTGVQMRKLAEPYVQRRRAGTVERTADGRSIRRLRNAVTKPLGDALHGLATAREGLEAALRTLPPEAIVDEWTHDIDALRRELDKLALALTTRER